MAPKTFTSLLSPSTPWVHILYNPLPLSVDQACDAVTLYGKCNGILTMCEKTEPSWFWINPKGDYFGCVRLNQVIALQQGDREVLPFALKRKTAMLKNAQEMGASRNWGSQSYNCKELSSCQNPERTCKRVLRCSSIVQWYVDYGCVSPWPEDSVKLCLSSSYT